QGELKNGTVGYACRGPQPATVGFNDRTADRQPHAHAAGFGGEEGAEQPVHILGGDSDAAIRHTYQRLLFFCMASMPFITRLMITCCSWTRSPRIMARAGANSIRNDTRWLVSSRCTRATTSLTTPLTLSAASSFSVFSATPRPR